MRFLISLAALAIIAPASATAQSVVTIGTSQARGCYEAAMSVTSRASTGLALCEAALAQDALSRRDRAATEVNMGILLMHAGRSDEALAAYDRALGIQPQLAEAWLNRGIARFAAREYALAEADFTRSLELNIREAHKAYYHRALALDARELYPQAYADFQQALELAPGWNLPLRELERYEVVRAPVNG
ncbi:tetratricopeptide repeat protein [Glycocaulis abyssi]|uniref:Tetratricopeptide repeat protein n=1 Tax=Glycocaulis abyssi TaxID=1433403 RepID=A0ABV9NA75_9PROT